MRKAKHERKRLTVTRTPPVLLPTSPVNPRLAARLQKLGVSDCCRSGQELSSNVRMQALRSAGHWSLVSTRGARMNSVTAGTPSPSHTEHSILNAYLEVIRTAHHFIYIENQFYISWMSVPDGEEKDKIVQNRITQAIYDRVVSAYRYGDYF